MKWLKDYGVAASWHEYQALPMSVLEDCRILMEGQLGLVPTDESKETVPLSDEEELSLDLSSLSMTLPSMVPA